MHRGTAERRQGGADHVVAIEHLGNPLVDRIVEDAHLRTFVPGPRRQKTQRHDPLRIPGKQRVAGHLLGHEPGVGLVLVEAANEIIAIPPGIRPGTILVVAVCLGKMSHVDPVPRPAFAVTRAGQKPIDHRLVGRGGRVGQKGIQLLRGGRQPGQVERHAPQQHRPVRRGRSGQAAGCQPGANERIDRVGRRSGPAGRRHGRPDQRTQRPMLPGLGRGGRRVGRPDGPLVDPGPNQRHLLGGQELSFGRHAQIGVGARDALDQQAFTAAAGHDRHAVFPAAQSIVAAVEPKIAFLPLGAMTGKTAPLEHRQHLADKIDRSGRLGAPCRAWASQTQQTRHQPGQPELPERRSVPRESAGGHATLRGRGSGWVGPRRQASRRPKANRPSGGGWRP